MNGVVAQAVEAHVSRAAKHIEEQLDAQLDKLDNLKEEDISRIRQKRLHDLKRRQEKTKEWLAKGHGEYREIHTEKEFFDEMKGAERMICHFYRDNWPCKVMDKHMALLAPKHVETKFVKLNAEKAPFLTDRLKIWMLPTLALIKNEKTVDYVVGFDDLGGKDDFTTEMLVQRLARVEIIETEWAPPVGGGSSVQPGDQKSVRAGIYMRSNSDEDSDFEG